MIDFLPEKLNLDGTFEEIFKLLYSVFESDIKSNGFKFNSLPVIFDNRKIDSEYEEGFWHIVTRGKEERIPDYKRAKRLPWLRPLVENYQHPEIFYWIETNADKRGKVTKHYIWYKEGDYLIILKEFPKRYFLTTAYYVFGYNKTKYQKKYDMYKKRESDD